MVTEDFKKRFDAKWQKDETTSCWLWTASCAGQNGYGQIKLPKQRKQEYAHRVSYVIHKGPIPEGRQVCHTCDTPRCVNPKHLFVGTSSDNHADMKAKGRHLFGERNGNAKLTTKQVRQIYELLDAGLPQRLIGKAFDVSQNTVSRINRHERWEHLATPSGGDSAA